VDGGFPFDLVGRRRLDEDVQTDAVASWLMSRDRYLGKLRSPVVRPRRLKMRAASWANVLSPVIARHCYSSANDPVMISPAGSYVAIATPVVETLLSTSFSPEGMVPSENKRLPDPMTSGKTQRRYWSTRLWRKRIWMRFPLPRFTEVGGAAAIDDVYLDPMKFS